MKANLIFLIGVLSTSFSWAGSKVSECEKRPDFLGQNQSTTLNLKALPKMVFIGKSANYYVEHKSQGLKMWGEHSFVKGESRVVCASAEGGASHGFSIYAPTLIDLTGDKNIGDSYWQFHMMASPKQFGIWNQKSRLFSKSKDLEEGLAKIGAQVQIFQISHDEYELFFTRETEHISESLSVRFDAVSKLP